MFQFRLQNFKDEKAVIGSRSIFNITVLENDDANGVFVFAEDSLTTFMSKFFFESPYCANAICSTYVDIPKAFALTIY